MDYTYEGVLQVEQSVHQDQLESLIYHKSLNTCPQYSDSMGLVEVNRGVLYSEYIIYIVLRQRQVCSLYGGVLNSEFLNHYYYYYYYILTGVTEKEKPPLNVVGDVDGKIALLIVSK